MKPIQTLLAPLMLATAAFFLVSQAPNGPEGEQPPAGAAAKIAEALPQEPFAKPTKERRLLVFSVTNGFRHASIATGKLLLKELGETTGAFTAVISDDLANFEEAKLNSFDAICFLNTTQDVFMPTKGELDQMDDAGREKAKETDARLKKNLMAFVKGGKGFIGIHAATDTLYEWPEYGEMMNGYFDGHPWGATHDVSIKVDPANIDHPLVAMFEGKNLDFQEEIYQFRTPYDSSKVDMLLRLDPERTNMDVGGTKREDNDYGVSWARNWEDGRVFYCSLGHNHNMFWNPTVVRHYLAGIQWAMGDFKVEVGDQD